jgi:hypothetical protein
MNYFRRSLPAGVLTLVLALPAFAGEMDTPGAPPAPIPVSGESLTHGASSDPLAELALTIMQSVLALL